MGQVRDPLASKQRVYVGRYLDNMRDHRKKLWWSEDVGGFKSQQLRENVYLAPTLRRETKRLLDGVVGPLPKVLEAYMGEATWPNGMAFTCLGSTWGHNYLV